MKKWILICAVFLAAFGVIEAEAGSLLSTRIVEEEVEYTAGDVTLKGYFVYNSKAEGKLPGVIVVHEWWGHNDYARKRARQLAKMGYAAFALDMFGDGKTADHPSTAQGFVQEVVSDMKGIAKVRFNAALDVLKSKEVVDKDKIAAIGYCFGGTIVIQMARYGTDLKGVVSFHGGLSMLAPTPKDRVKAEILVFNGAADPFVKPQHIEDFKIDMENSDTEYTFINYPGVKHSFTNPGATKVGKQFDLPLEYDREADKDSWEKTEEFLQRIFAE